MFLGFIIGFSLTVLSFIAVWMFRQVSSYILANGEDSIFGIALLALMLFFFSSCSVEEALDPPTCIDGSCNAQFILDGELDENGFYHVKLNWGGEYNPRFNIEILSTLTDPWYWYNGSPVVQANFYTDTMIDTGYEEIPIVQSSRVYLSQKDENIAHGKRTVGPVPIEYKNDTIFIEPEISWEAGTKSIFKTYNNLKIIVE